MWLPFSMIMLLLLLTMHNSSQVYSSSVKWATTTTTIRFWSILFDHFQSSPSFGKARDRWSLGSGWRQLGDSDGECLLEDLHFVSKQNRTNRQSNQQILILRWTNKNSVSCSEADDKVNLFLSGSSFVDQIVLPLLLLLFAFKASCWPIQGLFGADGKRPTKSGENKPNIKPWPNNNSN